MVDTIKFSEMTSGGNINNDDKVPGLLASANVLFNNPWVFLPPGSTAQRPAPSVTINYRLRFNTDDQLYEYYNAVLGVWTQLEESAVTQGPFITYTADASLPDAQNLGLLADGILRQTITAGVATLDILSIPLTGAFGGTGINNGASTLTLGGSLSTIGAFTAAFTMTGNTAVTFPTSGTLATTTGASGHVSSGLINELTWYAATGDTVSGLPTGNNGVLITSVAGVPSISSTLPSAVQDNITRLGAQAIALNMNSHLINNVTNPVSAQDAMTLNYAGLTYLALAGGTMTGDISMGSAHRVTNALDPSAAQDYATKNYVDQTALTGTSVYAASAASLGTVTQSGSGVGATLTNAGAQATFALDGVNPPVGSNVLIKNTAAGMTAANEGIYIVSNAGSGSTNWVLTRATTYDTPAEINNTGLIVINNGSTLAGQAWYNTVTIVTVDTTSFSYSRFGSDNVTHVVTQVFDSTGSGTYTPTSGMVSCLVEIVGGGGSGGGVTGGTAGQAAAASGGAGGGYCKKTYTAAEIGANAAVTIGAGGVAATAGANNGNAGAASVFDPAGSGVTLTGNGGGAGNNMAKSAAAQVVTPATGGTGTNGDINISGQDSGYGMTQAGGVLAISSFGGSSQLGSGGYGDSFSIAIGSIGGAGKGYGAGSGGAAAIVDADHGSNAGQQGICIITEFVV